jgi:hypothetical protein
MPELPGCLHGACTYVMTLHAVGCDDLPLGPEFCGYVVWACSEAHSGRHVSQMTANRMYARCIQGLVVGFMVGTYCNE